MADNIRGNILTNLEQDVEYKKDTGIKCPTCGNGSGEGKRTLHIRSVIDNTVELECPNCGYAEHKPKDEYMEIRGLNGQMIPPTHGRE